MFALVALSLSTAFAGRSPTNTIPTTDTDGDGVWDVFDVCAGANDNVDLDADGTPDCSQTFVVGAGFDSAADLQGWTTGSTSGWTATYDAQGWSGSGAIYAYVAGSSWIEGVSSACIAVSGSTEHRLLANLRLASADPNPRADIYVAEYPSLSTCNSQWGAAQAAVFHHTGTTSWDVMGGTFTTASSTRYVSLYMRVAVQANGTQAVYGHFDNILLHDDLGDLGALGDPMD